MEIIVNEERVRFLTDKQRTLPVSITALLYLAICEYILNDSSWLIIHLLIGKRFALLLVVCGK